MLQRIAIVMLTLGAMAAISLTSADAHAVVAVPVKDIMKKLHKGEDAPLVLIAKDLKAEPPKWDEVQKFTKDFETLGADLGKNQAPRGAKDSWDKMCKDFATNAQAMNAAAQKKDKAGTLAARTKLTDSCAACHKAHKPE